MAATRRNRLVTHVIVTIVGLLVARGMAHVTVSAQAPASPAYVALGDSIEFGLRDDIALDGIGYVAPFGAFLGLQPADVHNFGVPFAQARDILLTQVPAALAAIEGHGPVVVSWGGGGNDLAEIALGPQAAACTQPKSCLARFNAMLNEVEQTIDLTIARIRKAIGPGGLILMRTQYNAIARSGCRPPDLVALGFATLEGAPGTILDRGLNDRIRAVADKYDARVVDIFPLSFNADELVADDCIHPSGLGYQVILTLFKASLAP